MLDLQRTPGFPPIRLYLYHGMIGIVRSLLLSSSSLSFYLSLSLLS